MESSTPQHSIVFVLLSKPQLKFLPAHKLSNWDFEDSFLNTHARNWSLSYVK